MGALHKKIVVGGKGITTVVITSRLVQRDQWYFFQVMKIECKKEMALAEAIPYVLYCDIMRTWFCLSVYIYIYIHIDIYIHISIYIIIYHLLICLSISILIIYQPIYPHLSMSLDTYTYLSIYLSVWGLFGRGQSTSILFSTLLNSILHA